MDLDDKLEQQLSRKSGASPEQKEAMNVQLSKFNDWYGTCRTCNKERKGTIAELKQPCGCVL